MSRTTVYIVTDDTQTVEKTKSYFETTYTDGSVTVANFHPTQWKDGLENPLFRKQLNSESPTAPLPYDEKNNVLPFPGVANNTIGTKISTMNEIESKAIENAIAQHRGNLTEAAKALGIGRATLYRKVKLYQIDPSQARKKRAA